MVTRWALVLGGMLVVGILLAVVGGTAVDVVGITLSGVAVVGAVSLAFLAVGRSEDRARAEEAERRGGVPRPPEPPGNGRLDDTRMKRRRDH